jgi:hypothetical protein
MKPKGFEILGAIRDPKTIAVGKQVRDLDRLEEAYGKGRWRKRKGFARIRRNERVFEAEIHWYEATGIGKFDFKIKRELNG